MGQALQHKKRILAQQQAEKAAETQAETMANMGEYEQMLVQLAEHKQQLSAIRSVKDKIALKHEIIPVYQDYISGVLKSASGVQDDVLMHVFVWACDAGEIDLALELGDYALNHDLKMPAQFERDVPSFFIEEMAEAKIEDADTRLKALRDVEYQTTDIDVHDDIRAKLYKGLGEASDTLGDIEGALGYFNTAIEFDDKIGVKTRVKQLEKMIKEKAQGD